MNTKSPLVHDVLKLSKKSFAMLQEDLDVTYTRGHHETEQDFRLRVLTELDNRGSMRLVEAYINN